MAAAGCRSEPTPHPGSTWNACAWRRPRTTRRPRRAAMRSWRPLLKPGVPLRKPQVLRRPPSCSQTGARVAGLGTAAASCGASPSEVVEAAFSVALAQFHDEGVDCREPQHSTRSSSFQSGEGACYPTCSRSSRRKLHLALHKAYCVKKLAETKTNNEAQ